MPRIREAGVFIPSDGLQHPRNMDFFYFVYGNSTANLRTAEGFPS